MKSWWKDLLIFAPLSAKRFMFCPVRRVALTVFLYIDAYIVLENLKNERPFGWHTSRKPEEPDMACLKSWFLFPHRIHLHWGDLGQRCGFVSLWGKGRSLNSQSASSNCFLHRVRYVVIHVGESRVGWISRTGVFLLHKNLSTACLFVLQKLTSHFRGNNTWSWKILDLYLANC